MKTVIVGGVAAGMSVAAKLKRELPDEHVIVFEKTQEVSYGACGLPYYVSGENPDLNKMRIRTVEEFIKSGIDVRTLHEVVDVQADKKCITVKSGDKTFVESYDRLVIATGASAIVPPLEGVDLPGVFTLKTLEDGEAIKSYLPKVNKVVIVGGGYIGLEVVEAMKTQGKEVVLIERLPRLLTTFDTSMSDEVLATLKRHQVDVRLNESVQSIKKDKEGLVVTSDLEEYPTDMVIFAVGVRPNTKFVKDTGIHLLSNGAIITDVHMRTNVKDIYAAGDCSSVIHFLTNKPQFLPLGTNANKQGKTLAEIFAGNDRSYHTSLGSSMIKIIDREFAKTGLGEEEALEHGFDIKTVTITGRDHAGYYPNPTAVTIKLVVNAVDHVILGAQLFGEKNVALRLNPFVVAITQKMTAEEFGTLDFGYAPPFASTWDVMHIAANAIK